MWQDGNGNGKWQENKTAAEQINVVIDSRNNSSCSSGINRPRLGYKN